VPIFVIYFWIIRLVQNGQEEHTIVPERLNNISEYVMTIHENGEEVIRKEWVGLTDEEINKLWAESHEDSIAMQQGFTTQQHYFAHLILRKAQEK